MPKKTRTKAKHGVIMDGVKSVDSIGRVALGMGFANKLVTVREVDDTEVVVTVVRVVPEREAARLGAAAPKGKAEHGGRARAGVKGMWAESKGSSRRIMRNTGKLADAVAATLGSEGRPMTPREIAKAMLAKGFWPDEGDGGKKLDRAVWNIAGGRPGRASSRFVKTPAGYALAPPR
jgi:hypothetical protein